MVHRAVTLADIQLICCGDHLGNMRFRSFGGGREVHPSAEQCCNRCRQCASGSMGVLGRYAHAAKRLLDLAIIEDVDGIAIHEMTAFQQYGFWTERTQIGGRSSHCVDISRWRTVEQDAGFRQIGGDHLGKRE